MIWITNYTTLDDATFIARKGPVYEKAYNRGTLEVRQPRADHTMVNCLVCDGTGEVERPLSIPRSDETSPVKCDACDGACKVRPRKRGY